MEVVHQLEDLPANRPLHLAIGMFDGVHLGHQAVIRPVIQLARETAGLAAILTFFPHPSAFFRPQSPTPQIFPPSHKERLLRQLGVDYLVVLPFGPDLASTPAPSFLSFLKTKAPALATVSVGENFQFGAKRLGDLETLRQSAGPFGIRIIDTPRLACAGQPISSTRIRSCLAQGQLEEVAELLGHPYATFGSVITGKQLGRTIGFPTLNLPWNPEIRPPLGVYAVQVYPEGANRSSPPFPAVANYGLRPTVEMNSTSPLLEVHLLDPEPPLPSTGDLLRVEWLSYLRPERRFENLAQLQNQIQRDTQSARAFFATAL